MAGAVELGISGEVRVRLTDAYTRCDRQFKTGRGLREVSFVPIVGADGSVLIATDRLCSEPTDFEGLVRPATAEVARAAQDSWADLSVSFPTLFVEDDEWRSNLVGATIAFFLGALLLGLWIWERLREQLSKQQPSSDSLRSGIAGISDPVISSDIDGDPTDPALDPISNEKSSRSR